jgi:hypothetical protein
MNMATHQGTQIQFTLREDSPSREYLFCLHNSQYNGADGVTVIMRSGVDVLETLTNSIVSLPGELSTGDKTQGSLQYTIISPDQNTSNM